MDKPTPKPLPRRTRPHNLSPLRTVGNILEGEKEPPPAHVFVQHDIVDGDRPLRPPAKQQTAWIQDEIQDLTSHSGIHGSGDQDHGSPEMIPLKTILPKPRRIKSKALLSVATDDVLVPKSRLPGIGGDVNAPSRMRHDSSVSRLSVDDSSLEGSRSQTPQSRTFRDKLRDRIESVREKAGSSVVQLRPRTLLTPLRPAVSHFDEILQEEEVAVVEALEKHNKICSRWKEAARGSKDLASSDEAYDFFTQVWEEEDEPIPEELVSPRSTGEDIVEDDENVKLTAADYLGLKDEWDVVEYVPASNEDPYDVIERERRLYFRPSSDAVPTEKKLPPDCQARYLEGEGIYVGTRPYVAERNLNRLEQRLLANGDRKWFGEDGEVILLPDPRRSVSYKPAAYYDGADPELELEYKPAVIQEYANQLMMEQGRYFLALNITSLRFSHHALFSREHVVAQRVAELHESYERDVTRRHVERLAGRLEALRRARNSLRQVDPSSKQDRQRLVRLNSDIGKARRQYLTEARANLQGLQKLIVNWQDLVKLREDQGYASTSLHLNLVTVMTESDSPQISGIGEAQAAAWKRWHEEIEAEVREVVWDEQAEYNERVNEYKKKMVAWSNSRLERRELARSRLQKAAEEITDASSETIPSLSPELERPVPPTQPDLKVVREEVTKTWRECFRPPDEPEIVPELLDNAPVDPRPSDIKEQQRRSAVKRTSLTVKVLFNDKEVCQSRSCPLGSKFTVEVRQSLQILIEQWPESLKLQLLESSGLSSHLLAEVFVPLPDRLTTVLNATTDHLEFSSSRIQASSHAGVGSGVSFTTRVDGRDKATCLYTTGEVGCRVAWGVDEEGVTTAPPDKYLTHAYGNNSDTDASAILGTDTAMDVDILAEWARKSQLDPNDPRNASFFHVIDTSSRSKADASYFRLDPLDAEFRFCDDAELETNPRLRLLRLRDLGEPEFRGLTMIPNREREIDKDVFKKYEENRATAEAREVDSVATSPLDSHRLRGQRFLLDVRQRVLRQCRLAQQHRSLQDIILEDQVLAISTLGLTFMKWLQPKRPLRPKRRERKKVTVQHLAGQDVRLIVNVVRAFEVPVRKEVEPPTAPNGFPVIVPVRPFVEVSFQGQVARTTAADGANPTWNQDLQLPLRPPSGDYSAGRLQEIKDCLFLHLFDETVVDLLEDDRIRETNIHQRLERNWLASLRIPFATLYHNSRIEGTFKLYSPPVLLGYEREPQQRRYNSVNLMNDAPLQRDATFLTLFITVQPALNPPEPFKERLESSEMEFVEHHLDKWLADMADMFPARRVKALVLDTSGKALCVTRFFRPLQPPVLEAGVQTTQEMAARFVSMIPVVPGSVLFPGLFDVWLTSRQVLGLLCGDSEDLATLLCCYFAQLDSKTWLLLGSGIPHGAAAYVLTRTGQQRSDHEYWLWDPTSGQKFSVLDSFCPLQRVYCIINDDNIWANVQREELPQRTRYDVTMRSDWCPAFGRNVGAPTGTVQPATLDYRPTSSTEVQRLQDKLEKHLRDSLAKWRRTSRTLWNRYCVAILRKLLPTLERAAWGKGEPKSPDHAQELQHILGSHKMCGFPINLPYTSVDAVTEAVRATGVHYNESPDVEFALAVYIHSFPSNVLSVWVYVASLTRRR